MAGFLSPKFGRPSITEKTNPRLGAIVAVRTYVSVAGKHEEISVLSEDQLLQLHYRQGIPPAGRMVAETIRSSAPSRSVGSDIPYDCQDAQAAIAVVGRGSHAHRQPHQNDWRRSSTPRRNALATKMIGERAIEAWRVA